LEISLHQAQQDIFNDSTRFKVCAAGRRFGKSYLAAVTLFVEAAKTEKTRTDGVVVDLFLEEVYYVAPTFEQGKKILWPLLRELGADLIAKKYENTGELTLINGRRISIKGSDRPDSLRGVGLSYVVLDEYAFMREEVWELIIMPALARTEGGALFIGTPDGKNHFHKMYQFGMDPDNKDYKSWHFPSMDNPFLPRQEIENARRDMSTDRFRQEFEASFESGGGYVMTPDMFPIMESDHTVSGDVYVAVDLAGFTKVEQGRKIVKRDDHAISVVKAHQGGWLVLDIINGKWDVRETALRLVKAFRDYRPLGFGIEKGIAMQAVLPYLQDEMNRIGTFFEVTPLSHGNQKKQDRIAWALQGRAEKGRIQLMRGDWNKKFLEQASDFPSPLSHDDLIDSLAYIDQIADPYFDTQDFMLDEWQPFDDVAGY